MRLILVRHGQTPSNVRGVLDTLPPGPGLTRLGQEQAAVLPDVLGPEPVGVLVASTALRARLTAAPLARDLELPVLVRPGAREVSAGDLEMRGDQESIYTYMSTIFGWAAGDVDRRIPGGPDGIETFGRFDEVVDEAMSAAGDLTAVVVCHGALIRGWCAARTSNVDVPFVARTGLNNTGAVVLERGAEGSWHALSWMGEAIGGRSLDDEGTEGPAGQSV